MSGGTTGCTDDQGEIVGELRPVHDFLPVPERLALRGDSVRVTLSLSRRSVESFKREAGRRRVPHRRMIRALLDEYARRHA